MSNLLKKISGWFGESQSVSKNSVLPSSHNAQHSMLHDGSETATRGQLVQVLLKDLLRESGIPPGWIQCQIQVMNSRSRGQGIYVRLVVKQWDERLMKYAFAFQKTLLADIFRFEPQAVTWLQGLSWQLEVAASCPLTQLPSPDYWLASNVSGVQGSPAKAANPVDPFDIIPLPAHAVVSRAAVSRADAAPPADTASKLVASPTVIDITLPLTPQGAATSFVLPELTMPQAPAPTLRHGEPEPASLLEGIAPQLPDETAQDLERLFAIRDNELANLAVSNMLPPGYESTEPSPLQLR